MNVFRHVFLIVNFRIILVKINRNEDGYERTEHKFTERKERT